MIDKIEKDLSDLPDNFIVAFITKSKDYNKVNNAVLEYLVNKKGYPGGYVAVNKPFLNTLGFLNKKKIDSGGLFFIDCITQKLGGDMTKRNNCVFIDSPSNLTNIGIALHEYVVNHPSENKFLFIDSLSTLMMHNDTGRAMKFIHYLTGKMRVWGVNGIMLSLHEDSDKKMISELDLFCDRVIRI